jgi:hypothetical protein
MTTEAELLNELYEAEHDCRTGLHSAQVEQLEGQREEVGRLAGIIDARIERRNMAIANWQDHLTSTGRAETQVENVHAACAAIADPMPATPDRSHEAEFAEAFDAAEASPICSEGVADDPEWQVAEKTDEQLIEEADFPHVADLILEQVERRVIGNGSDVTAEQALAAGKEDQRKNPWS